MVRSQALGRLWIRPCIVPLFMLTATAGWILTAEVGVPYYYSLAWKWPESTAELDGDHVPESRLKILFLSDPHIQCGFSRYEWWVARWDSDRYLTKAFSLLMSRLEPDMVVILGDVFAEGFKASEEEWRDYIGCMEEIFPIPEGVELVVVPGDNDIGGEGEDAMKRGVNRRYVSQFGELNYVFEFKGIKFIKVNTVSLIHSTPANDVEAQAREELMTFLEGYRQEIVKAPMPSETDPLTIVLSHIPIDDLHSIIFKIQILSSVYPDYIFSGHTHRMASTTHRYQTHYTDGRFRTRNAEELTVPTCSYRMGEAIMGVGTVVIGEDGHVRFAVLWLPQRYPFLFSYAVFAALIAIATYTVCKKRSMIKLPFIK